MQRKVLMLAGVAALLTAYIGSRLLAQAPGSAAPSHTKIGFINMALVLQKYKKAEVYKNELEAAIKPAKEEIDQLKKNMEAWQKYLQSPSADPKEKVKGEQAIVDIKRKIEDIGRKVQKDVGKKREDQMTQLYKEVHTAVQGYAAANGYHAVLAYVDPPVPPGMDPFAFPLIQRKLHGMDMAASVVPFYFAPGLDISDAIAVTLNQSYAGAGGGVPAIPTSRGGD